MSGFIPNNSSVGSGGVPSNIAIWRDGSTTSGNIYSTFQEAYTALSTIDGPKILYIDAENSVTLPVGAFDMDDIHLSGLPTNTSSTITINTGTTLSNLQKIGPYLQILSFSDDPIITFNGDTFENYNIAILERCNFQSINASIFSITDGQNISISTNTGSTWNAGTLSCGSVGFAGIYAQGTIFGQNSISNLGTSINIYKGTFVTIDSLLSVNIVDGAPFYHVLVQEFSVPEANQFSSLATAAAAIAPLRGNKRIYIHGTVTVTDIIDLEGVELEGHSGSPDTPILDVTTGTLLNLSSVKNLEIKQSFGFSTPIAYGAGYIGELRFEGVTLRSNIFMPLITVDETALFTIYGKDLSTIGTSCIDLGGTFSGNMHLTGRSNIDSDTINGSSATLSVTVDSSAIIRDQSGLGSLIISNDSVYLLNFVDADLSSGILTITHNLQQSYPVALIFNNNNVQIIPDTITSTNANVLTIDLTTQGTLTGTWHASVRR